MIGGTAVPGMDIVGSQLSLSGDGRTLTVTTKVVDLSKPSLTSAALGAPLLHYVTRWQMGNTLYYAAMQNTAANQPTFYAGKTQSVDLCSVSACFPHVLTYPEPDLGGRQETGAVQCPATPSAKSPCTITVKVSAVDVIKGAAPLVGGGGGGRPTMARAGGKDPAGLDDALDEARRIVTAGLGA